jgi:hypothetical protein
VTLDALRTDAVIAANKIELNWEAFDNHTERMFFEEMTTKGKAMIPELETIYLKLTSGKNVVVPDEGTTLGYTEVETYTEALADELHHAYILRELHTKYTTIQSIIKTEASSSLQLNLFTPPTEIQ